MKGGVYIDVEAPLVKECHALVTTTPGKRKRFPESCVEVVADEAGARAAARPGRHPALVMGPSRSSEGVRLYYLVRWLDES
jgi:hypothetical protein